MDLVEFLWGILDFVFAILWAVDVGCWRFWFLDFRKCLCVFWINVVLRILEEFHLQLFWFKKFIPDTCPLTSQKVHTPLKMDCIGSELVREITQGSIVHKCFEELHEITIQWQPSLFSTSGHGIMEIQDPWWTWTTKPFVGSGGMTQPKKEPHTSKSNPNNGALKQIFLGVPPALRVEIPRGDLQDIYILLLLLNATPFQIVQNFCLGDQATQKNELFAQQKWHCVKHGQYDHTIWTYRFTRPARAITPFALQNHMDPAKRSR